VDFKRAGTKDEVVSILAETGSEATILAGGTDVMVQYLRRELAPALLVHIENIDELRGVESPNGRLEIGALTTHREAAEDSRIRAAVPALAEAAEQVGGRQTQAVGTVGGNLCNASPAADTAPPLLVAAAELKLVSTKGTRVVPIDRFFLGRRRTDRRPDEVLTAITVGSLPERTGETYLKVGRRGAMEVAIVGLAARITLDPDLSVITDARLAMCSVAPHPLRLPAVEQILVGSRGEEEAVGAAAEAMNAAVEPIDDARSSAEYRRRLLAPLLGEAVRVCLRRARERVSWS
jgi:carbon-monoxide dehydrogenase medium subunit